MSLNELLNCSEAAEYLKVSKGTLSSMRYLGTGPAWVKVGGRAVRYRQSSIDEWLEASERTSTAA